MPICSTTVMPLRAEGGRVQPRSEEHTSELQSPCNLVCRLLLEKKKKFTRRQIAIPNSVASTIGITQSTFSVKLLTLFSRSRRKTNQLTREHSAIVITIQTRIRYRRVSVTVVNVYNSRSRKTNKRNSKQVAMLRNKETRQRMCIGLFKTTRKQA